MLWVQKSLFPILPRGIEFFFLNDFPEEIYYILFKICLQEEF